MYEQYHTSLHTYTHTYKYVYVYTIVYDREVLCRFHPKIIHPPRGADKSPGL